MPLTPADIPALFNAAKAVLTSLDAAFEASTVPASASKLVASIKWARNADSLGGKSLTKKELRIIGRRASALVGDALDDVQSPEVLEVAAACVALVAVVVAALAD